MSIVKRGTGVETVGVSPKVAWPTVALVVVGVVVGVLDLTGLISVDDSIWIALLGAGGGAGALGFVAPPSVQRFK